MSGALRNWILLASTAAAGSAAAAPEQQPPAALRETVPAASTRGSQPQYEAAAAHYSSGDYDQALERIGQGLATAPEDLELLNLKAAVLLQLRDYAGALAAYRAYLDARPRGPDRRRARKIIGHLLAAEATFLELTVSNGPAPVYLDSIAMGPFCQAALTCRRAVLPGENKVIVERPGFERWTGQVQIERGKTALLAVSLVEKPSLLSVRATTEGARVTVDGVAQEPSRQANVAYGVAGAAAVGAAVLWLTGAPEARVAVTPRVGGTAGLDVLGRF